MIAANELRIGNWVEVKMDCVSFNTQATGNIIKVLEEYPSLNNPIPISEEWLRKFGFEERYEKGELYKDDVGFSNGCIYLVVEGRYISKMIDHIECVHQLQNLFFALTGEELTIKENVQP